MRYFGSVGNTVVTLFQASTNGASDAFRLLSLAFGLAKLRS